MKKISVDFQGWPIEAMTLGELLERLGILCVADTKGYTLDNGKCTVAGTIDRSLLEAYPKILEDDGMGYGIKPKYITEVSKEIWYDEDIKENVFNIFADYQETVSSEDQT